MHIGKVEAAAAFAPFLHELNKGKGTNAQEFPVLNTIQATAEQWWDSLNCGETFEVCGRVCYSYRHDVGSIAMHFHKMSANYKWDSTSTKYSDLTKSQKKIIDFVFAQKDKNYSMFYLPEMLKL